MILKRTEGNRGRSLERRNWLPSSPFLADKIHVRRLGLKLDKNYKAPRVQRSGKKSQPQSGRKFFATANIQDYVINVLPYSDIQRSCLLSP